MAPIETENASGSSPEINGCVEWKAASPQSDGGNMNQFRILSRHGTARSRSLALVLALENLNR